MAADLATVVLDVSAEHPTAAFTVLPMLIVPPDVIGFLVAVPSVVVEPPEAPASPVAPRDTSPGVPSSATDGELVRDLQEYFASLARRQVPASGPAAAWNRFYVRYRPVVERAVARAGLPPAERDDAAQEIWAELMLALPRLSFDERRGRLESWVATVIRRRIGKFRKNRRCRPPREVSYDVARYPSSDAADPVVAAALGELQHGVRSAVAELAAQVSPTNWQVLCLRLEGRTAAEVAERLSLSTDQVAARQHRILRKLLLQKALRRLR